MRWLAVKYEGMEQAIEHPRTEGALPKGPAEVRPAEVQPALTSPGAHPTVVCRWRRLPLMVPPGTGGWLAAAGQ